MPAFVSTSGCVLHLALRRAFRILVSFISHFGFILSGLVRILFIPVQHQHVVFFFGVIIFHIISQFVFIKIRIFEIFFIKRFIIIQCICFRIQEKLFFHYRFLHYRFFDYGFHYLYSLFGLCGFLGFHRRHGLNFFRPDFFGLLLSNQGHPHLFFERGFHILIFLQNPTP